MTPPISKFVSTIKKTNPDCKIILEYGAYPFERELGSLRRLLYLLNKNNERKVHGLVNFVITYGGQKDVDGVPNIPIDNGIDLDPLPVIPRPRPISQVSFIGVSSFKKWHAYERFIVGMAEYLKKPGVTRIHFDIVGNGPEYDKLTALVKELKLEEQVTFHGFKTGRELDEVYEKNHIAIGTLGFHRIGITKSSSLKNREYFARGLPVILSTPDDDMPADLPFVLYVPGGEDPLDVSTIVSFAQKVYNTQNLNEQIRRYAENKISWNSKIRTVLEYLNLTPTLQESSVR